MNEINRMESPRKIWWQCASLAEVPLDHVVSEVVTPRVVVQRFGRVRRGKVWWQCHRCKSR
jgi:hypothetical protein